MRVCTERLVASRSASCLTLLHGEPGLHPLLLSARVVLDIGVAMCRQHLGGLLSSVSGGTATVHDDLLALVRQERRRELGDLVRRQVDGSGKVGSLVLARGENLSENE
jgi:hypothetical protein